MAYQIVFRAGIKRDLKKLNKHEAGKILLTIVEKLSTSPEVEKPLKGRYKGLRRLRIGDYRVTYSIEKDSVIIAAIKHRKNAYED